MVDDLFPPPLVGIEGQIRAIQREMDMRDKVYGRLVKQGKMTTEQANREIAAMKAVYQTLVAARDWKKHLPPITQFGEHLTQETAALLAALDDAG